MESLLLGAGFLLAIFGPLLLLPVAWLLQRLLRPLVRRLAPRSTGPGTVRALGWGAALLLLAAVLAGTYYPGRVEYERLCLRYAMPQIAERVQVEGFYRERLFPYETHRLFEHGFAFLETEDPQRPRERRLLRYRRDTDGNPVAEQVAEFVSRYGASQTLTREAYGIVRTEKRVFERADGRLLARAGEVRYDGGPLSLFFGAHAITSCPDIRSSRGSREFMTFYDLEAIVLGGRPLPVER